MTFALLEKGRVSLDALTGRIRAAFPDLAFTHVELNDFGEDHAVLVLDGKWVFRFPRSPRAASYAAGERRLLARLAGVTRLAVPAYAFVSPDGGFGGYRMIPGEPLGELAFASLGREVQTRVMEEIGDFLFALHGLPIQGEAAASVPTPHGHPPGRAYVRRFAERRRSLAAAVPPALLGRIDSFYENLPGAVDGAERKLIHGDLSADHILLAPGAEGLAGVIDFTDAGPGDPAFDFTCLWGYGDWAARHAASRHGDADEAEAILARSRWWFARCRIDQIWWSLNGYRDYDVAKIVAELPGVLDALGV